MNAKAKLFPLVIVLSVLSAHVVRATDDPKKKQADPPPKAQPQAQPHAQPQPQAQPHAQPQAQAQPHAQPQHGAAPQAPNASAKATTNRPNPAGGVSHPQQARAPLKPGQTPPDLKVRLGKPSSPQARSFAKESYKTDRTRFTRTVAPLRFAAKDRPILTHMRIVPGTYYYRRNAFYDTYGWATPSYVYTMYPRYGLWDTSFLAFSMNHVAEEQYAMMMYHHWADPEMQQWAQDTNLLAAQNPELRAQLDALNSRMSRLEQSGIARDPSYVPPDAQDLALSPDAIDQFAKK